MKNVHILNGGFRSWSLKNLPVESYGNKRESITSNTLNGEESLNKLIGQYEEQSFSSQSTPITYIVDYNYVNDIVQNYDIFAPHYSLIDVASNHRNNHNHIPTSIWITNDDNDENVNMYTNPDGTMRSGVDILTMWDKAGIDYKRKHLIFYSSSYDEDNEDDMNDNEASAAEVMFYAELMGLYKISVYEGGWREWQRRHEQQQINDNSQSSSSTTTTTTSTQTQTQTSNKSNQNTHKQKVTTTATSTVTSSMSIKRNHTMSSVLVNSDSGDDASSLFFKEQFNKVTAASSSSYTPPPSPHMPIAHVTPPAKTITNSASSIYNTHLISGLAALFSFYVFKTFAQSL